MARRNVRMEEYLELVYQWHRGRSIRQIRDSLQISRKTIRKYLRLFMARGLSREKPLPPQEELARMVASVVQVAVFEQPARERIRLYHQQILAGRRFRDIEEANEKALEGTVKLTDLAPNQRLGHSLSC